MTQLSLSEAGHTDRRHLVMMEQHTLLQENGLQTLSGFSETHILGGLGRLIMHVLVNMKISTS